MFVGNELCARCGRLHAIGTDLCDAEALPMTSTPSEERVNHEAWSKSLIGFIREKGLEREFTDWCGGWPCPITGSSPTSSRRSVLEEAARVAEEFEAGGDGAYACGLNDAREDIARRIRALAEEN